MGGKDIIYYN